MPDHLLTPGGSNLPEPYGWSCIGCPWKFSYDVTEARARDVYADDPRHGPDVRLAPPLEVRPEARVYYASTSPEDALEYARERVEEWSYDEDPHGYCHERPTLKLLLRMAQLGPGGYVCPDCLDYFTDGHTCGDRGQHVHVVARR